MPDPSTTRIALYKSKSDGSELVNYSQDLGQNWDRVDAAVGFQAATSSTRPSSPYSGKPIFETDTSYRTFFSNGTSPASGSWVEIPNGSAQYNSTLRLASGKQINVNSSGSGATLAVVNAAAGTDLISGRVTGDTQDRFLVDTDGTLNWGAGGASAPDVNLYRGGTNTLKTDDSFVIAGDLKLVNGTTIYRNKLSTSTTVANTASETVVATLTIPAGDAVVGAVYRIKAWGTASVTGTPTLTLRSRLGGVAGAALGSSGARTASSGVTNRSWQVTVDLTCLTTGGSGTWFASQITYEAVSLAASPPFASPGLILDGTTSVTADSTVSEDFVLTATWSAASTSNTLTCRGYTAERVA